ncbi:hypothetical protein N8474_06590 [Gammaproteobacteria bacterium]|nr:hypothetical protein [Gammaproteobacteria bacterium]
MNNLTNLKTDDLIISELNEAIDINSSKKTIAYKYFRGNLNDLEKYLNTSQINNSNISLLIPSKQLELFS